MGVSWQLARWLCEARRGGAEFGDVLTLGRLDLLLDAHDIADLQRRGGFTPADAARWLRPRPRHAEPFLLMLGARSVQAMDYSDYEGAAFTHDLNQPVPAEFVARFDTVIDGGTLEHVFNVAQAFGNAMRMLKVGGRFFSSTPANNMMGHGFYCFSPEFHYRVFSADNGFAVRRLCVFENYRHSPWYHVPDPRQVQGRIRLVGADLEVGLLVEAVKLRDAEPLARPPQQSDYAQTWTRGPAPAARSAPPADEGSWWRARVAAAFPGLARAAKRYANRRRLSLRAQPAVFRRAA